MKALVNSPAKADRLSFQDVPEPEPHDDETVLSVRSFSINRGELALMRALPEGWRPGQDVAGIVEKAARSGNGPKPGQRVAALIERAGWAERVAVPVSRLALMPDGIDLEQAAGLPMVGLTGLGLVRRSGPLIGRRMAVTGASGGVGSVLVQLGQLAGAEITAIARMEHAAWLTQLGAKTVIPSIGDANERFDVILESVGGASLEAAISHIAPNGRIICFGNSSATKTAFDIFSFFGAENASVQTFFSYRSFVPDEIGTELAYLISLVAGGQLKIQTNILSWKDVTSALMLLESRETRGKLVLVTRDM
jgi:NADPH2:quinone reductase